MSVTRPGSIERFTSLTNGAYNAPIGCRGLNGDATNGYAYHSGGGVTLNFNGASATAPGKISAWANAAGAKVDLTYNNSGQLQSICEPTCGTGGGN